MESSIYDGVIYAQCHDVTSNDIVFVTQECTRTLIEL